jgi:hypothetical protein
MKTLTTLSAGPATDLPFLVAPTTVIAHTEPTGRLTRVQLCPDGLMLTRPGLEPVAVTLPALIDLAFPDRGGADKNVGAPAAAATQPPTP